MTSFSTPAPKSNQKGYVTPYKTPSTAMNSAKAVDLVTGKTTVEYFFDPSLIIVQNEDLGSSMTPFKIPSSKRNGKGDDNNLDSLLFSSKHLFAPCTIIKSLNENVREPRGGCEQTKRKASITPAGPALVKTRDGTLYKIKDATKLVALTSPDDYVGLNDVLHLTNVTESSLLHTIRVRYKRDDIYTSAGPILISVNPYKQITFPQGESLYSEKMMMRFRTSDSFSEEYPHLFKVADRAYSAMMDSVHIVPNLEDADAGHCIDSPKKGSAGPGQVINQSIIISGESGAGKTEATKYIMKYLARITKKREKWTFEESPPFLSPDGKEMAALEDRVLSSNPLLETFGNAQTLRNDNSSRFGKFIHINFSTEKGVIMGARVSNYLLEKTRITTQIEGERNYHIFYQLFAGADSPLRTQLGLDSGPSSFRYLGNRSSPKTEKDKSSFDETMECLSNVGLASEEQNILMGLAAAVLHIGNISFEVCENEDHSATISKDSLPNLHKACELLGLKVNMVVNAILTKLLTINGKSIKKPSTVAMAEDRRDSFAKMTYSSIFLWLIKSINHTLGNQECNNKGHDNAQTGFIGVLDIYGFECFEVNGYEQLLINFCNEKLQRHFNRHVFEVEQKLYSSEGVDWTYITFNDNQPCLDLIEGGGGVVGILSTLDDSYSGMGSISEKDTKFVSQLHKLYGSVAGAKNTNGRHAYFGTPKFGNDKQFNVFHYAGEVRYTADGFVEKNMESTSSELKDLGSMSIIPLARDVFGTSSNNEDRRSSIRGFSVASQFKLSLQSLVHDLEMTQPHYIRCIKPNLKKSSSHFSAVEVLKQLRYSGMMEAIRIRREGYGLREDHQSFYNRFSVLLSADDLKEEVGIDKLVGVLSKRLNVTDADWQIGHSKIFLRRELSDKLERLAKLRVHRAARTLGRFGRFVASHRASSLLVNWVKFRLSMIKKYRAMRSSSKIAATYRMHIEVGRFQASINAIVKIQSLQRKVSAKLVAAKLRDPYYNMSHKDLKKLLRSEITLMEKAIDDQDFKKAAFIEEGIESIKISIAERTPMTRKRLEENIALAQKKFDDVIQSKDYKAAGPLQDELEEFMRLRKEYPTLEELKDRVTKAEDAVANAAKMRDFANAASLQLEVINAKTKLDEALREEDESIEEANQYEGDPSDTLVDGIRSRTELENELKCIHDKIDAAILQKDFNLASLLQATLEEREKLRSFFPSLEELQDVLKGTRKSLEDAIASKNFENAAGLNEEISVLEQKVEDEKHNTSAISENHTNSLNKIIGLDGKELVFESRLSLEIEIKAYVSKQANEISSKKFSKAQQIQALIDQLEFHREDFPTVDELRLTIANKQKEMNTAISQKRFGDAEKFDEEINTLETKLQSELRSHLSEEDISPTNAVSNIVTIQHQVEKQNLGKVFAQPTSVSSAGNIRPLDKRKGLNIKVENKSPQVAKLRPKKPLVSSVGDSVLSVTQMLASKRGSASLVVSNKGGLAGIITDTDITRRLVAKNLNASSTSISSVMTPNPTCVSPTDSAMDAMSTMVENHFRHLPVVDGKGGVVGLLDIAKCLNDAISKLEKSDAKSDSVAQEALSQVMRAQGAHGTQAAALQALLSPLMSQAFGNQVSPSLRSLIAGQPSTVVHPSASVFEAGIKMTESRKAALIVEDGRLVGIFGFKDMMTRVVAKELAMNSTRISTVMTPNPEFVSPEMTVLEALQTMHENRFLTLPVCEDDGKVVGLVNVMDVICGCGGADGWRSIFSTTLDLDDLSDSASHTSGRSNFVDGIITKTNKTVMDLRPKKSIIASVDDSILTVTKNLTRHRRDAAIVVDSAGKLKGIMTDTDITRRVVARGVDVKRTNVSDVMTPNPKYVDQDGSGMEAMMLMIENRFRHIPVVNQGKVVGTLDIAKCLNDAILKLEASASAKPNAVEKMMKSVLKAKGSDDAAALESLLYPLISKTLETGSRIPSLRSIASKSSIALVPPEASVLDAATAMSDKGKAALIVEEGQLIGIFGFKDMMTRVVAPELNRSSTPVSMVMTPEPEFAEPDMTAIEALKMMHETRFLTLPVCEENGTLIGIVDVMDLINACGGTERWRSIFELALQVDDSVTNESVTTPPVKNEVTTIKVPKDAPMVSSLQPIPSNIPSTLEFHKGLNEDFDETTLNDTYGSFLSDGNAVTFKIIDPDGNTHRIRTETKISFLREILEDKLKGRTNVKNLSLKFFDEEGDAILISTDDDLVEAVNLARNTSQSSKVVVKLVAEHDDGKFDGPEPMIIGGIGIAIVAVALGVLILLPKQKASRY